MLIFKQKPSKHAKKMVQSVSETELDFIPQGKSLMGIYVFVMVVLAVMIVVMAVRLSGQVQKYRQDYKMLQDMKSEYRKLQVEHQKLLIEQQTFSAMPIITSRAVHELGMRLPSSADKLILQPNITDNTVESSVHPMNGEVNHLGN